jgi:hypothetical protein
MYLQL